MEISVIIGTKFTGPSFEMQKESVWKHYISVLDLLSCSGDIREQSRRLYKIDQYFAHFGPKFFRGAPPPPPPPPPPNYWNY